MGSKSLSITLDDGMLKQIDFIRGDIPRSRFIQRRLEESLKKEGKKQ